MFHSSCAPECLSAEPYRFELGAGVVQQWTGAISKLELSHGLSSHGVQELTVPSCTRNAMVRACSRPFQRPLPRGFGALIAISASGPLSLCIISQRFMLHSRKALGASKGRHTVFSSFTLLVVVRSLHQTIRLSFSTITTLDPASPCPYSSSSQHSLSLFNQRSSRSYIR